MSICASDKGQEFARCRMLPPRQPEWRAVDHSLNGKAALALMTNLSEMNGAEQQTRDLVWGWWKR